MGIYYVGGLPYDSEYLAHYGITGQKWGIRRYQNPDGTLTADGKKRYNKEYKPSIPVSMNEKGKKELDTFKRMSSYYSDINQPHNDELDEEYGRLANEFNSKFNDSSQSKSRYNIPKNSDAYTTMHELDRAYEKMRRTDSGFTWNKNTKKYDINEEQYSKYKKAVDYYWKVRLDFAGKALRSIGYEDTQEARKLVDELFQLRA